MSIKRRLALLTAAGAIASTAMPGVGFASSHREAPMIAMDPTADLTDVYAFVSPDKPDTVTLIANVLPFQEPGGGPNFYNFDDNVLYSIYVDNDGDGEEDVEFEWQFKTTFQNPESFLYSGYGPIEDMSDPQGAPFAPRNITQTYTLTMNGEAIGTDLLKPPDNIGPRTTPEYGNYREDGTYELDNGIVTFAGQADDPFFVDVQSIFDLGGLRPFNEAHLLPLPTEPGVDVLAGFNVNSLAVQVPIEMLTRDGKAVSAPDAENAVIGVWAETARRATSVLSVDGGLSTEGDWVQVSRLGNPLINEVVIPVGEKDEWNRSEPKDDFANFGGRFLNSELAAIINTIYPTLPDIDTTDRTDLVLILGQGVPGLNATNSGETAFDYLRLNMGIPPAAEPSRLGVLAGDLAGFPNGRRLWDDVVDIEIRVVAQGYGDFLAENFKLPNKTPNNMLGDGCDANDVAFSTSFPYVSLPHQGYEHADHHSNCSGMPPSDTASSFKGAGSRAEPAALRRGIR
jgi:hypothetical protein